MSASLYDCQHLYERYVCKPFMSIDGILFLNQCLHATHLCHNGRPCQLHILPSKLLLPHAVQYCAVQPCR